LVTTWINRLERDVLGVKQGVTLEGQNIERLLPDEVRGVVEEMALRYQKLPVEPRLDKETGIIIAEQVGISIDIDKTLEQIQAAVPSQNVNLVQIKTNTNHNSRDLMNARTAIGNYSTWFHGSPERYQNISTALQSLNNIVIWPGEVFSFNETTGPRTPERGYLPAPIILNGGYDVDYGGGVCQVASTVYNAAVAAGLVITERHSHTKPVHYVPEGRDAAVDYGSLDLKYTNNRNGPLIIKTSIQNSRIYVEFRGER
jgi:vancomycin resistance protein YoaR